MAITKLKLLPRSTMKAKSIVKLASDIVAGDGIEVEKSGRTVTVSLDADALGGLIGGDLAALESIAGTGIVRRIDDDPEGYTAGGVVTVAEGGTGATSFTENGVIYSGASALASTAAGAKGAVLTGQGAAAPVIIKGEGNAKAFGVTGDGSTNDTTAAQAIIDDTTFGTKYFPAGTYMLGHIDLVSGIKLKGDGIGKTIFKLRAAPTTGTDWFYALSKSDIEIEGITFDANDFLTALDAGHLPNVVPCIYIVAGARHYVHNCEFKGWDTCGFATNTANNVRFQNNKVTRASSHAGYISNPSGTGSDGAITSGATTFTSASASFAVGDIGKMIAIEGGGNRLVALITARGSATSITLNRTSPATFSGASYRYGNTGSGGSSTPVANQGIFLGGTGTVDGNELHSFVVDGNVIENSSIAISGHDGSITNNIISGHGFGAGIHTQGLASNFNITITGNKCVNGMVTQDTAGAIAGGIENWAAASVVANNVCVANPGPGISIGGRTDVLGNVCRNNGQANTVLTSAAGFAGIAMFYQDATFNANGSFVNGNICTDTQASKTQEYGYSEHSNLGGGNGSQINVGINYFAGNLTADTSLQSITSRTTNMATTVTINAGGFSGGTFTSPAITGANPLTLLNVGTGAFNLQLRPNTTMTANRILNLVMGDTDRTLTLAGNFATGGQVTYSGSAALTLNVGGTTNLTFPTDNTGSTIATLSNGLGSFASTTSSQLAGVISDETGTAGSLVFSGGPTLTGTVTINTSGNLNLRSSSSSVRPILSLGRTASESVMLIEASAGVSAPGTAAADFVIRADSGNLFLVSNSLPIKLDTTGLTTFPGSIALVSGAALNWNSSDVTLTHSADTLTMAGGSLAISSSGSSALAVGLNGATNPALQVDASTASSATGVKIKSAAAAAGVDLSVVSSGTNEALRIDAKGSGAVTIASTSTGAIALGRDTTAAGFLRITSADSQALIVGPNGISNPSFRVNASGASAATGVFVLANAAASGVDLGVLSSGTNENLRVDAKGSGTITLNSTGTGAIQFSRNAVPTSSDGAALGTTSLMWSDLFVASGAVLNFNNGDVTITHSADTLTMAGGVLAISSAGAAALTVGANGATNPALTVDASTASSATGLRVKSAAAAGGVDLSVLSSGTNEALRIDAKGTGGVTIGGTSTGAVAIRGTTDGLNASSGFVGEYASGITTSGTATITVTIASPAVVTWTAHGMALGSSVRFTTTGALPTGITAGTTYWVIPVDANTFQIATSPANAVAGTAVNTSGSQSGTHSGFSRLLLTTGVTTSYAFINLTAGDWDVFLLQTLLIAGTTTFTTIDANISLTLDTYDTTAGRFISTPYPSGTTLGSTSNLSTQLSSVRISRSSTTIVYANAFAVFGTSTIQAYGLLYARRVR